MGRPFFLLFLISRCDEMTHPPLLKIPGQKRGWLTNQIMAPRIDKVGGRIMICRFAGRSRVLGKEGV